MALMAGSCRTAGLSKQPARGIIWRQPYRKGLHNESVSENLRLASVIDERFIEACWSATSVTWRRPGSRLRRFSFRVCRSVYLSAPYVCPKWQAVVSVCLFERLYKWGFVQQLGSLCARQRYLILVVRVSEQVDGTSGPLALWVDPSTGARCQILPPVLNNSVSMNIFSRW